MTTPDFGSILIDAETDAAMIWTNWLTYAHEYPIIWAIPAVILIGIVRAFWPKKRRGR
jgi:hypothetical protein